MTWNRVPLKEQCAKRKAERKIIRNLIRKFELAAIETRDKRVQEALFRLPGNASIELRRQVIKETINDQEING